jgi:hypothetical protein
LKRRIKDGETNWKHEGKGQALHPSPKKGAVQKFLQELEENLGEIDPTENEKVELPRIPRRITTVISQPLTPFYWVVPAPMTTSAAFGMKIFGIFGSLRFRDG